MCSTRLDMYHAYIECLLCKSGGHPDPAAYCAGKGARCIGATGIGSCGLTKEEHENFDYEAYDKWWDEHDAYLYHGGPVPEWMKDIVAEVEAEEARGQA